MKTVVFSAALLLATATAAYAAEPVLITQSNQALASGLWAQSAALSEKALAAHNLNAGDTVKALTSLCISEIKLNHFDDALGTCDKAVAADPNEWTGYVNRGNLKAMLGYITSAHTDYVRAQALNPTHPVVQAALESKPFHSSVTAPFVAISAVGAVTAKGAGGALSATAQ